jgi:quercetin dioxygenase-like cupin family protein
MTIFHRAPVTQVIFAFEPGGELADHAAHGLVTIHVLGAVWFRRTNATTSCLRGLSWF